MFTDDWSANGWRLSISRFKHVWCIRAARKITSPKYRDPSVRHRYIINTLPIACRLFRLKVPTPSVSYIQHTYIRHVAQKIDGGGDRLKSYCRWRFTINAGIITTRYRRHCSCRQRPSRGTTMVLSRKGSPPSSSTPVGPISTRPDDRSAATMLFPSGPGRDLLAYEISVDDGGRLNFSRLKTNDLFRERGEGMADGYRAASLNAFSTSIWKPENAYLSLYRPLRTSSDKILITIWKHGFPRKGLLLQIWMVVLIPGNNSAFRQVQIIFRGRNLLLHRHFPTNIR